MIVRHSLEGNRLSDLPPDIGIDPFVAGWTVQKGPGPHMPCAPACPPEKSRPRRFDRGPGAIRRHVVRLMHAVDRFRVARRAACDGTP